MYQHHFFYLFHLVRYPHLYIIIAIVVGETQHKIGKTSMPSGSTGLKRARPSTGFGGGFVVLPCPVEEGFGFKVFLSHMPTFRKFLFLPVVMVIRFFSRVARLTGFS